MTPGHADLWFLPLGGCGEIGINMNLYGHDGRWLLVDCGIGFDRGGQRRVFAADPAFIAARRDKLVGLLVTHAHEDHVGAISHLWTDLGCPVFCTRFTAEILRRKLAEQGLLRKVPLHIVEPRQRHRLEPFDIEWFDVTHSTPESQALLIRTPRGNVFHTGDWKLDREPLVGARFDRAAFESLAREPVLAMVGDSTNAMVEGRSTSEGALHTGLLRHVKPARGRVVVACFGSNVARLVTLARVALAAERYPGLLGRSLDNYYRAARASGLWTLETRMIDAEHLGFLPPADVFAIATGSQGEPNAALSRLAQGSHPAFELEPGDTVIFSSRVIPGNENAVHRLQDRLRGLGADVVCSEDSPQPIHASGHPAQDELRDMYRWVQPRVSIPVHGEVPHMDAHAALAREVGVPMQLRGSNGDLFLLAPQPGIRRGVAPVGRITLDR